MEENLIKSIAMKQLLILTATILLLGCQTPPETNQPAVELITEKDATDLLKKWERAMVEKDSSLMKEVLHPEYQYAGSPDGATADRQAMMQAEMERMAALSDLSKNTREIVERMLEA